jgi:hypothetical protein
MLKKICGACVALLLINALLSTLSAHTGTKRDHLTPEEVELVREAQALDKRTDVFIKCAERRLLAINDPNAGSSKQVQKDSEKWGALPKGTRAQLLGDLSKILDEAITNIDDVASRDAKNPLLPKALRKLAAAVKIFQPQVMVMRQQTRSGEELAAIEEAIENIQSIIEAEKKLPPPTEKKDKDKGKPKS